MANIVLLLVGHLKEKQLEMAFHHCRLPCEKGTVQLPQVCHCIQDCRQMGHVPYQTLQQSPALLHRYSLGGRNMRLSPRTQKKQICCVILTTVIWVRPPNEISKRGCMKGIDIPLFLTFSSF